MGAAPFAKLSAFEGVNVLVAISIDASPKYQYAVTEFAKNLHFKYCKSHPPLGWLFVLLAHVRTKYEYLYVRPDTTLVYSRRSS